MATAGGAGGLAGIPVPAGLVHATGGWTRAGASRCPAGPPTRSKCPRPAGAGPAREPRAQTFAAPSPGPRGPARPAGSDGFQRSNPQLPRRRPLGPFPPGALVAERKKERAAAATHHGPRRGDLGGRRRAVQGSRRPSAPRSRRARSSYPHPRPARARPPPAPPRPLELAPLPRGARSRRAVSGARGPRPLPSPGRAGRRGRGALGRRLPRAASRDPPGRLAAPAAPPAGRAAICRPSRCPRLSAAQRSKSLGENPPITGLCPPPPPRSWARKELPSARALPSS